MLEDVQIAIVRTYFKERVVRTTPFIDHLFNEVVTVVKLKTDWAFLFLLS
jgi:hypothetical protein